MIESTSRNESLLNFFSHHNHLNVPLFVYLKNNILIVCIYTRLRLNVILKYLLTQEGHNLLKLTSCSWMNRNNNHQKRKYYLFEACLFISVPSEVHLPKLSCLATPDLLNGFAVPFVSPIIFVITEVC